MYLHFMTYLIGSGLRYTPKFCPELRHCTCACPRECSERRADDLFLTSTPHNAVVVTANGRRGIMRSSVGRPYARRLRFDSTHYELSLIDGPGALQCINERIEVRRR